MIQRIFSSATLVILCVLISFSTAGAERPQPEHIKILFGYNFPPFYTATSKKNPSQNLGGIFIDILKDFQQKHPQYKLEYKCLPRARITKVLTDDEADAFALTDPMFVKPEIRCRFAQSLPLWTIGDHLLVRRGSKIKDCELNNLIGKQIAVLHGNGYGPLDEYFEKGLIDKRPVYSTEQILKLVSKGRVDGAICNKATLPGLMKNTNYSMNDFVLIENPLYTFTLHLMVRRQQADFLYDFNKFIKNTSLPEI